MLGGRLEVGRHQVTQAMRGKGLEIETTFIPSLATDLLGAHYILGISKQTGF